MFKFTDIAIILFFTTSINILATLVSWVKCKTLFGRYFASGMIGICLWTLAAGLDYAAVPIPLKIFFAQVECLGYQSALAFLAASMMLYAGHEAWLKNGWVKLLLFFIPISNIVLAWTNSWHGYLWADFYVSSVGDNVVVFVHGPAFLWTAGTAYLMIAVIAVSLLQVAVKGTPILRKQALLLLFSLSTIVISNLLYLFDIFRVPGVDWSSISFSIVGILFLAALYGSRFLEIIPIARNILIEQMTDGILVLDGHGYLVDFNPAAQSIFGFRKEALWNKYSAALKGFPQVVSLLAANSGRETQGTRVGICEDVFDVRLIGLKDRLGTSSGQLIILRNISGQKRMEDALRQSEEKFYKAFHSSPDAILITRLGDGRLVEVNEGFCRITGYTREEALSSSSMLLGLWVDSEEREKTVAKLRENQRVLEYESAFRIKSGGILNCLYSAQLIQLNGEVHILSVVRDVTENRRTEEIVRLRLRLWEYSSTHSVDEIMQMALDEICLLTGSRIGFYHFVEEDQNMLSLRAWSTRTLTEFCKADGKDMHYPISEAGVWADCVREGKPVIHNDYATVPNRKGLPAGHAEVVRELVVPIMRNNQVVSILGVGNKAIDYDQKDIELVSYIADIIWTIVDQKRADEQIRQLNVKLEQLAMTDELTGLFNRRSFFKRGTEELKRSQRYSSPLSLLMLDIDGFKAVNDTYGHDAGDLILCSVTETLQNNIRDIDMLARLGGEEFGVLLPNTAADAAVNLAERLRNAVERATYSVQDKKIGVTLSIGVSTYEKSVKNIDHLLKNADLAMYRAKNQSRNRVVFYS